MFHKALDVNLGASAEHTLNLFVTVKTAPPSTVLTVTHRLAHLNLTTFGLSGPVPPDTDAAWACLGTKPDIHNVE